MEKIFNLDSRGHRGQGGEREDAVADGFQREKPEERSVSYISCCTKFLYASASHS